MSPFHDSFGLSIVPSSGPNISVRYNTVLGRPPMPGKWTERFGFGIELGGDVLCRDNLTEGYWWLGIVLGGKHTTVTHNVLRGPHGGEYATPTKISLEPGSDKATETIADNQQIVTASYIENPTGLTARRSGTLIDLSWQSHANNQSGFKVERRQPGGDYATLATLGGTATGFRDAGAVPGAGVRLSNSGLQCGGRHHLFAASVGGHGGKRSWRREVRVFRKSIVGRQQQSNGGPGGKCKRLW